MDRGIQSMLSRRRFDVDEYHGMARAGILHEDDHVELIDGELVEMPAVGSRHISCVGRLNRLLVQALGDRAFVTVQSPVRLDRYSEPEPDVAILRPRADDYASETAGPDDTFLLIEVADSSLPIDREVKLPLYAAAGIREVWIVDLTTETVEVYRVSKGRSYDVCTRVTEGVVSSLAFPDVALAVRDILPVSR